MTALLLAAALNAQQALPTFPAFKLTRTRIGNVVTAEGQLRNPGPAAMAEVKLRVIYFSGDREVRRSAAVPLRKIGPNESEPFKVETGRVPRFDWYQMVLEANGKESVYVARDLALPPIPETEAPFKPNVTELAAEGMEDEPPVKFPGTATVRLTATNYGSFTAWEPTAVIAFRSAAGSAVKTARVRLGDAVVLGSKDTFEVTVPACPGYEAAQVTLLWLKERVNCPAQELTKKKDLEIGEIRLLRMNDDTMRVTGKVRNGLDDTLFGVEVEMALRAGDKEMARQKGTIPGALKPGAVAPFDITFFKCPEGVNGYACSIGYEGTDETVADPPVPMPTAKRTKHVAPDPEYKDDDAPLPEEEDEPADPKAKSKSAPGKKKS